jgi:hypothetical protein
MTAAAPLRAGWSGPDDRDRHARGAAGAGGMTAAAPLAERLERVG